MSAAAVEDTEKISYGQSDKVCINVTINMGCAVEDNPSRSEAKLEPPHAHHVKSVIKVVATNDQVSLTVENLNYDVM